MKDILFKIAALALLCLAGGVAGFFIGKGKAPEIPEPEVHTEYKTVFVERPEELSHKMLSTQFLFLEFSDTTVLHHNDTTYIKVPVPLEQKEYGDSTYHAWVSGYRPQLDSIRFTSAVTTVTHIREVEPRWSFGVTAGYGVTVIPGGSVQLAPYKRAATWKRRTGS